MEKLCVFCGSSTGNDPIYKNEAVRLANHLVRNGITLIYGGGSVGIMGILADHMLSVGGQVTGVIPQFLYDWEVGHDGVTELIIVDSMHSRKQRMAEISDGFMALPGGFGTLEEMAEILTWNQLKLINKPVGILNINGFFDPLLRMLDNMVQHGFLKQDNRDLLHDDTDPEKLLTKLKSAPIHPETKWIDKT